MESVVNANIFKSAEHISNTLALTGYNRERLTPDPKDLDYIHLSDLRLFLDQYAKESSGKLLDYGCGGSPYRALFNTERYMRADYVDCGDLDCLIGQDGKLSLEDNSCDTVLSTQVLEHVFSPRTYLSEALRVLRPGGKLILTTHGTFQDHGCPYDFWRWTTDGLHRELEEAGFQVKRKAKLSTGPRAVLYLFSQACHALRAPRRGSGWGFWLLWRLFFLRPVLFHRWMDRRFGRNRMVLDDVKGHTLYIAIGVEAVKPQSQ